MKNVVQLFGLLQVLLCLGCAPIKAKPAAISQSMDDGFRFDCPIRFDKLPYCAQLIPLQNLTREVVPNSFQLRFWRQHQATSFGPYEDPTIQNFKLNVDVFLWMRMPNPGDDHGSYDVSVQPIVDKNGQTLPGMYDVSRVRFTMKGTWQIWIKLKEGGRLVDEAVQNIRINF